MYKYYSIGGILVFLFTGCTSKDTIPPQPPKDRTTEVKEIRSMAELENKLERIRNPIEGEKIGKQKKDARREVDALLRDAKRYKNKVSRFENAQLIAYAKAKKSYKHKVKKSTKKVKKQHNTKKQKKDTINMVNEYENKLKYY